MDRVFAAKKALVVGGTTGIGKALAEALAQEGALVTAIGRTPGGFVGDSAREAVQLNLELPESRVQALALARTVDILCIVWGPFEQKPLHETTGEDWDRLVLANLAFPGSLVSAALPGMRQAGWGRILLFGGTRTEEIRGFLTNAAYAAAKTGLSSLARSVSLAYAREGISCNVLCPGFVESGSTETSDVVGVSDKCPVRPLVSVHDIVETALFVLSRPLFNGIGLRCDKGWEPNFI